MTCLRSLNRSFSLALHRALVQNKKQDLVQWHCYLREAKKLRGWWIVKVFSTWSERTLSSAVEGKSLLGFLLRPLSWWFSATKQDERQEKAKGRMLISILICVILRCSHIPNRDKTLKTGSNCSQMFYCLFSKKSSFFITFIPGRILDIHVHHCIETRKCTKCGCREKSSPNQSPLWWATRCSYFRR